MRGIVLFALFKVDAPLCYYEVGDSGLELYQDLSTQLGQGAGHPHPWARRPPR